MKIKEPINKNYCAVVVYLHEFQELSNCDNIKATSIFFNQVLVGKDVQPGTYGIYFPVETQLSHEFLSANNLYRKPEWGNVNPEAKGFFEENGRVRAVKFRGYKSAGFWMPLSALTFTGADPLELATIGLEFDKINGVKICEKYVVQKGTPGSKQQKARQSREIELVEGQFRFHYDTEKLERNLHRLEVNTPVVITEKWHGTSIILANLLTKRHLRWWERGLHALGVQINDTAYALVAGSRRVVKSVGLKELDGKFHYYNSDIWTQVAKEQGHKIPKGFTVYGEVVGYVNETTMVQKGYDYGCQPGEHKLVVYRVTFTNEDGQVYELSWPQVRAFCETNDLQPVVTLWVGKFIETENFTLEEWRGHFFENLIDAYGTGQLCSRCIHQVPAEGFVLRIDEPFRAEFYKYKNYRFLEHETKALDKGEENIDES